MAYIPFEESKIWKVGMELAKEVYAAIAAHPDFSHDYALTNQMRRSAISVPSNIAEGFERASNKELIQYLFIAKGSAGELRTQLLLASELEYIPEQKAIELIEKAKSLGRMIQGLIKYLQKSNFQGVKYSNIVGEQKVEYQEIPPDAHLFEDSDLTINPPLWTSIFEPWILNHEFWILNFEPWTLNFNHQQPSTSSEHNYNA